jgi:hypothetical protein
MCPRTAICVSSYWCICVHAAVCVSSSCCCMCPHMLLYVCPQTAACVLMLLCVCLHACCCMCVLIVLICVLSCWTCVLMLLYMYPLSAHSAFCVLILPCVLILLYVSSYCYICVLILLYRCPHAHLLPVPVCSMYYMCPHTPTYVSIGSTGAQLYVCPHAAIYVSSYSYICVLRYHKGAALGDCWSLMGRIRPYWAAYVLNTGNTPTYVSLGTTGAQR